MIKAQTGKWKEPLPHSRLLELYDYDPRTGLFTTKRERISYAPGAPAGFKKKSGYTVIHADGRYYSASKLAWYYMTKQWPNGQVTNINGISDDNRFENLRPGKATKPALTQERLKQLLDYDPETGLFTWAFTRPRCKKGAIAGFSRTQEYIAIGVDGKFYPAHRLAFLWMTGEWPQEQVDHINHDKKDNRWSNLSPATNQQNQQNAPRRIDNTTGVTGVMQLPSGKYYAYITVDRRNIGLYKGLSFNDACAERKSAEAKYGFHENHGT